MRELIELAKKLEEVKQKAEDIGGYGFDWTSINRYGTNISVQIHQNDFPEGCEIHYDTSIYTDTVVKYTTIGDVRFIALISVENAIAENETLAFEYYGALI